MRRFLLLFLVFMGLALHYACADKAQAQEVPEQKASLTEKDPLAFLFEENLADGFAFPFGDGEGGGNYVCAADHKTYKGWYIATVTGEKYKLGIHTGEDWNGNGGGETDLGQPVYASAKGKVLEAKDYGAPLGNVVFIEHNFIENAKPVKVFTMYAHLDELKITKGAIVEKRQWVGTVGTGHNSFPAHLHFEIRKANMEEYEPGFWPSSNGKDSAWVMQHYYKPSEFIKQHRKLAVPARMDTLLVAHKSGYKMHLFVKGKEFKTYDISLSQSPLGHKAVEGDNKLPEGAYYITEKSRGPFSGAYSDYLGVAWLRISYPNKFDAEAGLQRGAISKKKYEAIAKAVSESKQPPANTGLGGGIGIHGWRGSWPEGARHLTWGCISMQNPDLDKFYAQVPLQTRIFIIP